MKKVGLLLVLAIFVSTITFAQNRRGGNFDPKERAKETTERMKEALGLDKAQEKKVYDINLKSNEKMAEMRKEMQGGGGFEGMREKMQKFREEQNKEMKKVLSDSQWKKYEKWMEEQRSRRGQGNSGGNRR